MERTEDFFALHGDERGAFDGRKNEDAGGFSGLIGFLFGDEFDAHPVLVLPWVFVGAVDVEASDGGNGAAVEIGAAEGEEMKSVRCRGDGVGLAAIGRSGGIEGDFLGGNGFFGGVVVGGGVAIVVAGFHGRVHLASERGGEFEGMLVGFVLSVDGDKAERQGFTDAGETVDARDADVGGGRMHGGRGAGGERLVVRVGNFGSDFDIARDGEIGWRDLNGDRGIATGGELGFALELRAVVGRVTVIVLIAEVVVPIRPIVAAMVAEEVITETLRVGVLSGDAAEIFRLAGGDRLALIVFGGELGGDGGGADGRGRDALGDLEGVAAEFFDAQRDLEAGVAEDALALAPVVVDGFGGGKFVGKLEADLVGPGFQRGELVAEVE